MKFRLIAVAALGLIGSGSALAQSESNTAVNPPNVTAPRTPGEAATNPGTTSKETLPPSVPPTTSGSSTNGAAGPNGTSSSTNPPGANGSQAPGGRASGSTTGQSGH